METYLAEEFPPHDRFDILIFSRAKLPVLEREAWDGVANLISVDAWVKMTLNGGLILRQPLPNKGLHCPVPSACTASP